MPVMVRHEFGAAVAEGTRARWRIATLLLAALGGLDAAWSADQAGAKPLDLPLSRQAGQWTGTASRERQASPREPGADARLQRTQALQPRPHPYGTGYEARMSSSASGGEFGAADDGPRGHAVPAAGPRGGNGKGR